MSSPRGLPVSTSMYRTNVRCPQFGQMDFFRFPVQCSKVYLYDLVCFFIDFLVVMMCCLWWNGTLGIWHKFHGFQRVPSIPILHLRMVQMEHLERAGTLAVEECCILRAVVPDGILSRQAEAD